MDTEIDAEISSSGFTDSFYRFILGAYDFLNTPQTVGNGQVFSIADLRALLIIHDTSGITISEVASRLRRTLGTMSLRISSLEKKGYIIKKRGEIDVRIFHLYCTEEGKSLSDSFRQYIDNQSGDFLHLIEQQISPVVFLSMLEQFNSYFDQRKEEWNAEK